MNKGLNKLFVLFAFFVILSSIFMSCTKKAEVNEKTEEKNQNNQKETIEKEISENKLETNKTKTSTQETEETLAAVLPDGLYSVERDYMQPQGKDTIKIEFELKEGKITKARLTPIKAHETSLGYINSVNRGLQDLVVGKDLKDINLPDKISGASLTTPVVKRYLEELQSA